MINLRDEWDEQPITDLPLFSTQNKFIKELVSGFVGLGFMVTFDSWQKSLMFVHMVF